MPEGQVPEGGVIMRPASHNNDTRPVLGCNRSPASSWTRSQGRGCARPASEGSLDKSPSRPDGIRRLLLALAILCMTSTASRADDFFRGAGESCFFGAAVLGGSAAVALYPMAANGATGLPVTAIVISNALFGCGLGLLGSVAAYGFGALYDQVAPTETLPEDTPRRRGSET